jgi:hypothetical protein
MDQPPTPLASLDIKVAFTVPAASNVYVDDCVAPRAPLGRVWPTSPGQYVISDASSQTCLPFELFQARCSALWYSEPEGNVVKDPESLRRYHSQVCSKQHVNVSHVPCPFLPYGLIANMAGIVVSVTGLKISQQILATRSVMLSADFLRLTDLNSVSERNFNHFIKYGFFVQGTPAFLKFPAYGKFPSVLTLLFVWTHVCLIFRSNGRYP